MLALPAFLASAASTLNLQDEILVECHCQPDDPLVDSYLTSWSSSYGAPLTGPTSHKQAAWDRPGIVAIKDELQSVLTDPARRLHFWQPLLLIQVTGSMLYPSLPVGCVWTTRQFVLLWLCASDYRCLRSPFLLLRRKRICMGSACLCM